MKTLTADLLGEWVGHIRIVGVLGEGGMGAVYVGFDDKLQRNVAVKVIHGEYRLHQEAKARFLREARILSHLNHCNICIVHDFIEYEDNDFLVLELVEGKSLRAAMKGEVPDQQKMSIARQLLEVLVAVHGQGVIHRDLKPENVMVDPGGEIKVLDFGLARSIDEEVGVSQNAPTLSLAELGSEPESGDTLALSERSRSVYVKTTQGTLIGTAGYMSPEQARAEPATAASDMYSVGLILQEMFTGTSPFERGLGGQALVRKTARGETLPVTGLSADLTALIERLKSLAPGARPSSVDALAHLQRIIDRPKRRRRRVVVAAVWLALALLAGGMTIQSVRASRAAERANLEASAAQEVSDFLVELFEESNPEQARGASLTAEEILKRGADRISGELVEQSLTRARLQATIGMVYDKMGLYDEAIHLVEEATQTRRKELGEEHVVVAQGLSALGDLYRKNGSLAEAELHLERALELRERLLGPDHLDVAGSLINLGVLYENAGRYGDAEPLLRRALAIQEKELGADHPDVAKSLTNLAILAARQGRVDEAQPLFERVLAIEEKEFGSDHPRVGLAYNNLAIAYKMQEKFGEAEPLYRHALEIQEKVLGPDHPDLARSLQNLANLYLEMERYEEAEPLYLRSLEISKAALGSEHPDVGRCLDNLAQLYVYQGRFDEGVTSYLLALEIRKKALGPEHPELGTNLHNLAGLYRNLGRTGEAESLYRRSLSIYRNALDPGHPTLQNLVEDFASFLRETGRTEEAVALEAQGAEPAAEDG